MNKLTVIIPLNEYNDKVKELLNKAVDSVLADKFEVVEKILIVHSPEITGVLTKDFKNKKVEFLFNNTSVDFPTQVNFAVKSLSEESKWFTVLEFDDEFGAVYFKNFSKYSDYYKEVEIFFPIALNVDPNGNGLNMGNNIAWAVNFQGINEPGFATLESLLEFPYLQFTGSAISKDLFIKSGMMKTNLRVAYDYEFFLRVLSIGARLMVIPKIGYQHMLGREGSIFESQKLISQEEGRFWFETAKKEFHFKDQREIDFSF